MTPVISPDGLIAIPLDLLSKPDWKPGDQLVVLETHNGFFIRRRHRLDDLRGLMIGASTEFHRDRHDQF